MAPTVQLCFRTCAFAASRLSPMTFGTLQFAGGGVKGGPFVVNVSVPALVPITAVADPAVGELAESVAEPPATMLVTAEPLGTFSSTFSAVPLG